MPAPTAAIVLDGASQAATAPAQAVRPTKPTGPRNRAERRAAEEIRREVLSAPIGPGHNHPPPDREFDQAQDGLGGILAFPMSEVRARLGISRSKAYEEIAAGRLRAVKCGTRTLIPYASGEAWLNSLPAMNA